MDMPFTNVIGNGGLLTTVGDLLKWNAFLDSTTPAVGGRALVETLETPMTFNSGRKSSYALGLGVDVVDGIREVTHGGSTAGYRTWLARYPEKRTSVAVLCNLASANATALGEAAIGAIMPRPPRATPTVASMSLTEAQLGPYVGLFRAPRTQSLIRTTVKDGRLTTELPRNVTPTPIGADRFRIPGGPEMIYQREAGRTRAVLIVDGEDTTRYEPVAAVTPSAAQLAAYAGSYWSDELDTRFVVVVRDGGLVLRERLGDETKLTPTFADGFTSPSGAVVFSRDAGGQVTGFGIWAGRIRNVRFRRE
jgi:hypothetical protein